jgi:outer membrane biosynthesis protein TonB
MRKPLIATAAAVAIAVLGTPTALAQDTAAPESAPEPVATAPEEPASDPVEEREPVEPPADPTLRSDPPPADDPPPPVDDPPARKPDPDPVLPTDPIEAPAPTGAPTDPPTSAPPTTAPLTSTSTSPPTSIVVDPGEGDDHPIRIGYHSKITFEGNRYSNSYTYVDENGRTRRGYDLDCVDFPDQAAAQAVLDNSVGDPFWLDADRDGRACEVDSGEFTRDSAARAGVRKGGQVAVYPAGSVDTGGDR